MKTPDTGKWDAEAELASSENLERLKNSLRAFLCLLISLAVSSGEAHTSECGGDLGVHLTHSCHVLDEDAGSERFSHMRLSGLMATQMPSD